MKLVSDRSGPTDKILRPEQLEVAEFSSDTKTRCACSDQLKISQSSSRHVRGSFVRFKGLPEPNYVIYGNNSAELIIVFVLLMMTSPPWIDRIGLVLFRHLKNNSKLSTGFEAWRESEREG